MQSIRSRDGTPIAYARSGTGPPLVLVHGTSGSHTRWAPVLPALEQRFSVYAISRRGYGESGDAADYAIEREFEDLAAVVDSIGGPVSLLGHSYGALCALEAALLTQSLRRLILYEPYIPGEGASIYPPGLIERMEALLEAGDREGVLDIVLRDLVQMPPSEIALLRATPSWPVRLAAVHVVPRESRAEERYRFRAERFSALTTPTMLLLGGESPAFLKASTELVRAALPMSRVVVMPGQQHIAMDTAPELFVREVVAFLTEAPGAAA